MLYPKEFTDLVFSKTQIFEHSDICCICVEIEDENPSIASDWFHVLQTYTTFAEQKKASTFLFRKDAIRHLLGRALLRKALAPEVLEQNIFDFSYTEFGKPYVPRSTIFFNISHSSNMICIALSSCAQVGIDVEKIQPIDSLLKNDFENPIYQMHEGEIASFIAYMERATTCHDTSLLHAFYRMWTRKEALSKACGLGLQLHLNSYQVDINVKYKDWIIQYPHSIMANNFEYAKDENSPSWTSYDIKIRKNYACSVVALAPNLDINCIMI